MATTVDQVATDALGLPTAAGPCWSKNCSPVLQAKPIPPWNVPIWTKYVADGRRPSGDSKLVDGDEAMRQVRSALGK